jgi:hypothetical protein
VLLDSRNSEPNISSPLEQIYRDVRAGIIHPLAGYDSLAGLGELALGIAPDTMLRWA